MQFKSKAQMRKFYELEAQGKLAAGTADRWAAETESFALPERANLNNPKKGSAIKSGSTSLTKLPKVPKYL